MSKIPIFIIGINPRSGTNYLYNLLGLHPQCVLSNHYGEDFIISGIHKYLEFYEAVTYRWKKEWNNNRADFKKALEAGIIKYLDPPHSRARYMVSKTPDPANAPLFLKAFSKGYMIIITRKGQDLVESYTTTFNRRFEDAIRGWCRGARSIYQIMNDEAMMNSGRVAIIKYEDLYQKNEQVMSKLLDLLHLDKSQYDFQKSQNFDVIGSSTFRGNSDVVTWDPVPKDKTFNPLNRFAGWSRWKHYRFNFLAGKYSKALGYELYYDSNGPVYYIYNWILTAYNFFYRLIRRSGIILKAFGKNKRELKRALQVEFK
jgi:hypothetical protein